MWFTVVRKSLPSSSYTVKTYLAHQLSCVEPWLQTAMNPINIFSFSSYLKLAGRTLATKSKLVENASVENQSVKKRLATKSKSVENASVENQSVKKRLATKSELVENASVENQSVKKSGPAQKSGSRRDAVPNDVLKYFISNGMEEFVHRIPRKLLNVKRKLPEIRYLLDEKVAGAVVDVMKEDLLRNESPILEASPGLGFITKNLLQLPFPRIQLYESSHDFRLHLNDLVKENADRLSMTDFNLFSASKLVFQDKMDNGTRLHVVLRELPRREWTAPEPSMRIIGVLPSLNFMKHVMLSLIFQCGLMTYGRPELYFIMEPLLYTHLTCDGTAGYMLYRTSSVLFQLIFECGILTKVPRKALFPWHTGCPDKKLPKVQNVNAEWVYLVKCVPRRDFFETVVPSEQLQQLLFFVRHNLSSRHNRIVPQLERWIPGCGPRVISKGMNIFSRFGDLSPQEILSLFHDFARWPEYSECPFQASVEYAYLKMEPGSEDLDETPTQSKGIEDETDRELSQ